LGGREEGCRSGSPVNVSVMSLNSFIQGENVEASRFWIGMAGPAKSIDSSDRLIARICYVDWIEQVTSIFAAGLCLAIEGLS
jgi:hypothetical protein